MPTIRRLLAHAIWLVLALGAQAPACVTDPECFVFDPCVAGAACIGGVCQYTPVVCDDGDPCTVDSCNSSIGCVADPLCPSDGLVCNGLERCFKPIGLPPICITGAPPDCDDGNACTLDGPCVEPNGCPHVPRNCDDGNPCTTDACDPATGCTYAPVADCCRTGADCTTDACTIRLCVSATCTDGTPVSCDDGDAATTDACDPASGCTHTTLPPASGCATDAECPADGEPCTVERCDGAAGCVSRPVGGFDAVACTCRRALPSACADETLPRKVTARTTRACVLIDRAATKGRKAARLLRRAGRLLASARTQLGRARETKEACRTQMDAQLADALTRAQGG
jgi:hypothetical protein